MADLISMDLELSSTRMLDDLNDSEVQELELVLQEDTESALLFDDITETLEPTDDSLATTNTTDSLTTATSTDSFTTTTSSSLVGLLFSRPDLVGEFDNIDLPDTIAPGDNGSVTVNVTNEGGFSGLFRLFLENQSATLPVTVNLYASNDDKFDFDENGDLINDALLASQTQELSLFDFLNGNDNPYVLNYDNVVVGPQGSYNLLAEVDVGNFIPESNETNNLTSELVSAPGTNAVHDWASAGLNVTQLAESLEAAPPFGSRNLAVVHSSVFDAVNAFDPQYESIFVDNPVVPNGASPEAAVVGAAYTALSTLFGNLTDAPAGAQAEIQNYLDAQLAASLAEIPDGAAETDGFEFGTDIAEQVIAARAGDGSASAQVPYVQPPGEYVWEEEQGVTALLPDWGAVDPFAVADIEVLLDQFPAPPEFGSDLYAQEIEEVRALGGLEDTATTDVIRNAEQSEIALFWLNDRTDTYRPHGQWVQIGLETSIIEDEGLLDAARTMALVTIANADAGIAAWNAKYANSQPRPSQVINDIAFDDDRDDTIGDTEWEANFENPPFPDYVSGHATFAGGTAGTLAALFGENYAFTATSQELPGITRSFDSFGDAATEAGLSRLFAGVHVTSSNDIGEAIGLEIGSTVASEIAAPLP